MSNLVYPDGYTDYNWCPVCREMLGICRCDEFAPDDDYYYDPFSGDTEEFEAIDVRAAVHEELDEGGR